MNNENTDQIILFTDLDGCLLNKSDYDFRPALPTIQRLVAAGIPIVLCSSKTQVEMQAIAVELNLPPTPMTCENGGVIVWNGPIAGAPTVLGKPRSEILQVLGQAKAFFQFRSFQDLGVNGVIKATDLPPAKVQAALNRHCTEPLLWDDAAEKIAEFRQYLAEHGLTLTQGGRFWHVASATTKGLALTEVLARYRDYIGRERAIVSIAIGDSPIDQSMLDVSDIPIGIPQPNGETKVAVAADCGLIADFPGSSGWAQSVGMILDRLGIPA